MHTQSFPYPLSVLTAAQGLAQRQNQPQRVVYIPLLGRGHMADSLPQAIHVDCPQLFDQNASGLITYLDLGSESRRSRTLRCRSDDHPRSWEELIRLKNDPEPATSLLVTLPPRRP